MYNDATDNRNSYMHKHEFAHSLGVDTCVHHYGALGEEAIIVVCKSKPILGQYRDLYLYFKIVLHHHLITVPVGCNGLYIHIFLVRIVNK